MQFETIILDPNPELLSKRFVEIFAYWEGKRGNCFAPMWGKFRLNDLDLETISLSIVVDVIPDPLDFKYCFFGITRNRVEGRNPKGQLVSEVKPPELGEKIFRELAVVVEKKAPIHVINKGTTDKDEDIQYEFLRLPLSSDDKTVNKIYSIGYDDRSLAVLRRQFGTENDI